MERRDIANYPHTKWKNTLKTRHFLLSLLLASFFDLEQKSLKKDRANDLIDGDDRQDQGHEFAPPFRESVFNNNSHAQSNPGLRDESCPGPFLDARFLLHHSRPEKSP